MAPHDDISHDAFAVALPEYLEGTLDDAARASMDAHAAACADCATLRDDLRRIEAAAAALPELAPSRDLWTGIESRIGASVRPLHTHGAVDLVEPARDADDADVIPIRRRWMRPAAIAAAIVLTASITYSVTRGTVGGDTVATRVATATPTPATAVPTDAVPTTTDTGAASERTQPAAGPKTKTPAPNGTARPAPKRAPQEILSQNPARYVASNTGEATYDAEIARLRAIVRTRRGSMDSTTLAVIEKNLKVIDDAIAQCRQALARDPNSRFLLESLNGALDTKVQLLRTAAMLPART